MSEAETTALLALQLQCTARITTANGSKYLQRLCKHFAHKVRANWDENRGQVIFAEGVCTLEADVLGLQLICSAASQQDLMDIVDTMDRHFIRFAKAEAPELNWQ
ncbi:MAG: DUF2218 domain-containing protein [Gammaproteobacteria bacterium]|nr:DUF2218 domain-containing protein [Gammaproteobacteria bacterium]MBU1556281.1 DUF2218 domain-containing protein [Gammaproteobacteria bacterium]MBU2070470.1 DUF2218 domain-containing protein [Gammaproteobacteria bacterium]MBU2185271.1 DUF2218 domain-containing protein [Gammaproteobacteria bacterium]MBU2205062.1 DUF2218 domain-containing protein [Gammaproteobacteria bacterium]